MPSRKLSLVNYSLLCAILLFGGWALSHQMGGLAMWIDEAWSLEFASPPDIGGVIHKTATEDAHPPLSYILFHWLQPFFGEHPFGLRVVGWFATLLSGVVVVRLGRELHSWRVGIIGAILLLTYPLVIGHTFIIRHYSLLMLFAVLSSWAYWRYSRHWSWRWGVVYWLCGALMLYTMYWGAFVLMAHGLHMLIYRRRGLLWMVLSAVVMGILLAPWIPSFLDQTRSSVLGEGGYHSALPIDEVGLGIIRYNLFGKSELLLMILAVAGMAGNFASRRWRDWLPSDQTGFLALLLFAPILLPILNDLILGFNLLSHRPLIVCVPAIVLLIAHVLSSMKAWQYSLLTLALVLNHLMPTIIPDTPERGPWWEVSAFLAQNIAPSDTLFYAANDDLFFYTLEQHALLARVPYRQFVHYPFDFAMLDAQTERVMWRIQFFEAEGVSDQLLAMGGYLPVTPMLDFGFFSTDTIRIMGFAKPIDTAPLYYFGDQLGLMHIDHHQIGDALHIQLLWQALAQIPHDYTITVFLLDEAGALVAQHDSFPLHDSNPTALWQDATWHHDSHPLVVADLPAGTYTLGIGVYTWWDVQNLPVMPCALDICNIALVDVVNIP